MTTSSKSNKKPRVIIATDMTSTDRSTNEISDVQTFIRFLLYADEFDIEGIIAAGSPGMQSLHTAQIKDILKQYEAVFPNLILHRDTYPCAKELLKKIREGSLTTGMTEVGLGKDTEASELIIDCVEKDDARPVWLLFCSGTTDLAQALWKITSERDKSYVENFIKKLRIFAVGDRDSSSEWIKENYPQLFYITAHRKGACRGMYKGGENKLITEEWINRHVLNHGPLGDAYPHGDTRDCWGKMNGIKEEASISVLYLLSTGLSTTEKPESGCWGGRYQKVPNTNQYIDASDSCFNDTSEWATVYRWRRPIQNDFQARLDWCIHSPQESSHAPVPVFAGELEQRIPPGSKITLSAEGSYDPDGKSIRCHWYFYREPGTYDGHLHIQNQNSMQASFDTPKVTEETILHIILTVANNGSPSLSRYQRIVFIIDPDMKKKGFLFFG